MKKLLAFTLAVAVAATGFAQSQKEFFAYLDKMEPAVKEFVTRSSVAKVAPVAQATQLETPDKAGAKK